MAWSYDNSWGGEKRAGKTAYVNDVQIRELQKEFCTFRDIREHRQKKLMKSGLRWSKNEGERKTMKMERREGWRHEERKYIGTAEKYRKGKDWAEEREMSI